ncbi:hypothetical protein ACIRP2_07820 [Streptomyces sp. NPDC101194]|uniref:hypothetical protein n=1 Tax=Streptomyces sp. NPDC101194 TaxID=3366127 RepID=UPI0038235787
MLCATTSASRASAASGAAATASAWSSGVWPKSSSFFHEGERPLDTGTFEDPFRPGLPRTARATSETELRRLGETLDRGARRLAPTRTHNGPPSPSPPNGDGATAART